MTDRCFGHLTIRRARDFIHWDGAGCPVHRSAGGWAREVVFASRHAVVEIRRQSSTIIVLPMSVLACAVSVATRGGSCSFLRSPAISCLSLSSMCLFFPSRPEPRQRPSETLLCPCGQVFRLLFRDSSLEGTVACAFLSSLVSSVLNGDTVACRSRRQRAVGCCCLQRSAMQLSGTSAGDVKTNLSI